MPSQDFEATRQPTVAQDQAAKVDSVQEAALKASIQHQQSMHVVQQMGDPSMAGSQAQSPRGGASTDVVRGDSSEDTTTHPDTGKATSKRTADQTSSDSASKETFRLGTEGTAFMLPGFVTLTGWQVQLVRSAAMAAGPLGGLFVAAVDAANAYNITVGIGRTMSVGVGAGGSYSSGIVIAPGNQIFVYESFSAALGAMASISDSLTITIVDGGIDRFRGDCIAATVALGEGLVVGGSVLLTLDREFLGVVVQAGVAFGMPFEYYKEVQRTWVDGSRGEHSEGEQSEGSGID